MEMLFSNCQVLTFQKLKEVILILCEHRSFTKEMYQIDTTFKTSKMIE